jgi:hypothetical protein
MHEAVWILDIYIILVEPLDKPIGQLDFTKQQVSSLRGDCAAIEGTNDFLGSKPLKVDLFQISL